MKCSLLPVKVMFDWHDLPPSYTAKQSFMNSHLCVYSIYHKLTNFCNYCSPSLTNAASCWYSQLFVGWFECELCLFRVQVPHMHSSTGIPSAAPCNALSVHKVQLTQLVTVVHLSKSQHRSAHHSCQVGSHLVHTHAPASYILGTLIG